MRSWRRSLILLLCVGTLGCGGGHSHLPPPRMPDEEDQEQVSAPAPGTTVAEAGPAAEVAAPPPAPATANVAQPVSPAPTPANGTAAEPRTQASPALAAEIARRKRVIEQLSRIGQGWAAYWGRGDSPPPRCCGPNRFSWRVLLLSDFGENDLFLKFSLGEPWSGPRNQALLPRVPDIFRSPGLAEGQTQFVVLNGPDTAFAQDEMSPLLDGAENTIQVIAVAPSKAVFWTSSDDYLFDVATVQSDFFGENQDCCYALFGPPTGVRRIPVTISDDHLLALVTPAGREPVLALDVTRPPTPEPDQELMKYLQENPVVRFAKAAGPPPAEPSLPAQNAPPEGPKATPPAGAPTGVADRRSAQPSLPRDGRLPVPDDVSQQLARRALRETHQKEYASARKPDEKKELAEKLLALGRSPDLDPAGRYAALELSRKIAVEAGDIPKALEALELTTQAFQTEGRTERAEILMSSIGQTLSDNDNELVLSEGRKLMEQTLEQSEFDLADQFLNAALSAARRTRDIKLIASLTARKKEIADARTAWLEVADYVDLLLQHPTHPEANEIVGTYYCLVKQRWEDGLPLLARAADPRLMELAEAELKRPSTPSEQVTLADRWWNFAEGETKHPMAIRARAAFWYREALSGLPPGLERIKAESRLAKAEFKDRTERETETP